MNKIYSYLTSFLSLFIAVLEGNVCYQTFYHEAHPRLDKIVESNLNVLQGHASVYAFQQRVLPVWIIDYIDKAFNVNFFDANLIFYRLTFVIISFSIFLMCVVLHRNWKDNILIVSSFNAINMLTIHAGYWLLAFDMLNLLFVILMLCLFFYDFNEKYKLILNALLFLLWQVTFEEAIYIPLIYFFYYNNKNILQRKFFSVVIKKWNMILFALIISSLKLNDHLRTYFSSGTLYKPKHTLFGQWWVFVENFELAGKELKALINPFSTLSDGYFWCQGAAIYFILTLYAFINYDRKLFNCSEKYSTTLILFTIVSVITLAFARIEETNTLLPMVAIVIALHAQTKTTKST